MAQLYTPWMAQAGQNIGRALETRGVRAQKEQQNKLIQSAYMGDPQAIQSLMQVNPQLGMQVQEAVRKRKAGTDQAALSNRAAFSKETKDIMSNIAKFDTFEEAKEYGDRMTQDIASRYPEIIKSVGVDAVFDENDFNQAKTMFGDKQGGAFAGTGMPAQVSSALVRGANDPEFRNTAEYARAWDVANKPDIIDTEEGRIPLYPKLSPLFKPPGDTKTETQEISEIKKSSKQDSEIIKGTEKKKTTADEKVSFGYYNRMMGAENSIKGLGDFDSASVWEQFKGVTNITASSELQQYRQAADDWIRAKLRRESGAVIAPSEMTKEYEIYFPRIGDSQAVIDQKAGARKEAERSMETASGRAFKGKDKPEITKKVEVPDVGFVSKGYEFLGGDPSDKASWRKQ